MNDYLTGQNANLSTVLDTTLDRLKGGDDRGQRPRAHAQPEGPARGARGARHSLRRRCRARGADRQGARHGVVPDLRSESRRGPLQPCDRTCAPTASVRTRSSTAPPPGLYAPGSIFKVVTASAAIDSGRFTPTSSFVDPGYCEVYGKRVNNYDTTSPFGRLDLAHGAEVLGQLGLLQHRQGAGREDARRLLEALRLLLHPAARDADERARPERPLQGDQALRPEGGHRGRSRPVRLRPGAAARDTAADGDGRRDDREQRRRDEAVRRRPHRRAGRLGRRAHQAAGARPSRQARDGPGGRAR